ncbi:uncharacterized protein LOC131006089 [Salvia miltiorrhiza]|uniref:uncharacterized protein LOC131006089 n=1 Tax=Salvia miltiorrhiza TaxID=226208 RepID=UPI0025AC3DA8|nr:uncharacterized protein LOC131006089 [Salvia miltiorrhiza]
MNHKANEHLLAFMNLGNKEDIQFLLVVWLCTIWCIWKERNACKFNQGVWRKEKLVAEIKTRIWGWLEAFKLPCITTNFRRWSLKARYFPRSDILTANQAHNPSFVWRSLLVGRDLLVKGIAWRVGDGKRIRIGKDAWLPDGKGNFKAARVQDPWGDMKINELLFDNAPAWDMQKVETILPRDELWKITENLDVNLGSPDRPLWPHGKGNSYSVKSGYLLVCSLKNREEPSSSSDESSLWNWVWGLAVIPKVKLFLWKCLSGCLPTAKALISRSIMMDPCCRRCDKPTETIEHALRDCPWATFLWESSPIRLQPTNPRAPWSLVEWIGKIREVPEKEVHCLFASVLWTCWYARNLLVFQNKILSHSDCLVIAERATLSNPLSSSMVSSKPTRVDCSRAAQVKINCDAGVGSGAGAGLGIALCDVENNQVGFRMGFLKGVFTVEEGEAHAVLEGLSFSVEKGFTDIIVETDCQRLFWRLHNHEDDLSLLGDILKEIYSIVDSLNQVEFSWCPREDNCVVDSLANYAFVSRSGFISSNVWPLSVNSSLMV